MTYKFVTREKIEETKHGEIAPVFAAYMVGIAYRLLAERDAYREVAILIGNRAYSEDATQFADAEAARLLTEGKILEQGEKKP